MTRRLYTDAELAALGLPRTDWPICDLAAAGGLGKVVIRESNGTSTHRFHDLRTGQAWGTLGAREAGAVGLALTRLRGLNPA